MTSFSFRSKRLGTVPMSEWQNSVKNLGTSSQGVDQLLSELLSTVGSADLENKLRQATSCSSVAFRLGWLQLCIQQQLENKLQPDYARTWSELDHVTEGEVADWVPSVQQSSWLKEHLRADLLVKKLPNLRMKLTVILCACANGQQDGWQALSNQIRDDEFTLDTNSTCLDNFEKLRQYAFHNKISSIVQSISNAGIALLPHLGGTSPVFVKDFISVFWGENNFQFPITEHSVAAVSQLSCKVRESPTVRKDRQLAVEWLCVLVDAIGPHRDRAEIYYALKELTQLALSSSVDTRVLYLEGPRAKCDDLLEAFLRMIEFDRSLEDRWSVRMDSCQVMVLTEALLLRAREKMDWIDRVAWALSLMQQNKSLLSSRQAMSEWLTLLVLPRLLECHHPSVSSSSDTCQACLRFHSQLIGTFIQLMKEIPLGSFLLIVEQSTAWAQWCQAFVTPGSPGSLSEEERRAFWEVPVLEWIDHYVLERQDELKSDLQVLKGTDMELTGSLWGWLLDAIFPPMTDLPDDPEELTLNESLLSSSVTSWYDLEIIGRLATQYWERVQYALTKHCPIPSTDRLVDLLGQIQRGGTPPLAAQNPSQWHLCQEIIGKLQRAVKDLLESGYREYTEMELLMLRDHFSPVRHIVQHLAEDEYIGHPIETYLRELESKCSQLSEQQNILNWIAKHQGDIVVGEYMTSDLSGVTLVQAEQWLSEIQPVIQQYAVGPQLLEPLAFLLTNSSCVLKYLGNTLGDWRTALKQTLSFYKQVKDRTLLQRPWVELEQWEGLLREICSSRFVLHQEVRLIQKWSTQEEGEHQPSLEDACRSLLHSLEQVTECMSVYSILPRVQELQICQPESIEQLKQSFAQENCSILDLQSIIQPQIGDLRAEQFMFFEQLAQSKDILKLQYFSWSEENFKAKLGTAFQTLAASENQFGMAMLHNLEVAYRLLRPLFTSTSLQPLSTVCKRIAQVLLVEKTLNATHSFQEVLKSRGELAWWMSRAAVAEDLEGFNEMLKEFQDHGFYRSHLRAHGQEKLSFYYVKQDAEREVPQFEESLRASVVFGKNPLKEECLDLLEQAHKVHALRLALEAAGHPDYSHSSCSTQLNQPGKLKLGKLRDLWNDLDAKNRNWAEALRSVFEEEPRLCVLNPNQLIQLVRLMQSRSSTKLSWKPLQPYLLALFPVWFQPSNLAGATPATLQQALQQIELPVEKDASETLKGLPGLLQSIANACRVYQESDDEAHCVFALLDTPWEEPTAHDIAMFLCPDDPSEPHYHPSQRFHGGNERTNGPSDLKRFLLGVEKLPAIRFVIHHAEELPADSAQLLIDWLVRQSNEVDEDEQPDLTVLCSRPQGAERFSFLPRVPASKNPHYRENMTILMNHVYGVEKVPKLTHWVGYVGKSTAIRCVARRPKTVNIYEDFEPSIFLRLLDSAIHYEIHWDVSEYAPMERFHQFLEWLLVWGIVYDERTGEMKHVGHYRFTFYFEFHLSNDPDSHPSCRSQETLMKALPLVAHFSTPGSPTVDSYTSPEEEEIASWVSFLSEGNDWRLGHADVLYNTWKAYERPLSAGAVIKQLLTSQPRQFQDLRDKRVYGLFIKLLSSRIRWLLHEIQMMSKHRNQGDGTSLSTLLNTFITESLLIATGQHPTTPIITTLRFAHRQVPGVYWDLANHQVARVPSIPEHEITSIGSQPLEEVVAALFRVKTEQVVHLLETNGYVLTVPFAWRLYFLQERCMVGSPVILEGTAGVGKTELMTLFAQLLHLSRSGLNLLQPVLEFQWPDVVTAESIREALRDYPQWSLLGLKTSRHLRSFLKDSRRTMWETTPGSILHRILSASHSSVLQTKEDFDELIDELNGMSGMSQFLSVSMHHSYSVMELDDLVERAMKLGVSNAIKLEDCVVVFIDEVNTTSCMGRMKSIFVDGTYHGKSLPSSIFWVAAMNPHRGMTESIIDYTGTRVSQKPDLEYCVRALPPRMQDLVVPFPPLTTEQSEVFIQQLLQVKNIAHTDGQREALLRTILAAQAYVDAQKLQRIVSSLRDILRTARLYQFLSTLPSLLTSQELDQSSIHWRALFVALAMAYGLRMPLQHHRLGFQKALQPVLHSLRERPPENLAVWDVTHEAMRHVYSNALLPVGVACTSALMENLYCTVVCTSAKIPLAIVGPPGCSKTISFSLAMDNLSKQPAQPELYRQLPKMEPFRYQCTEQSTSHDILSRFDAAWNRQQQFNSLSSEGHSPLDEQAVSVVFLDEVGLVPEVEMKAIHPRLDHPQVSAVLLSNRQLDAAKSNRTLQVVQDQTGSTDLITLVTGILFSSPLDKCRPIQKDVAHALSEAYEATLHCIDLGMSTSPFQLRDFVYFLRTIRGQLSSSTFTGLLSSQGLLYALQRNFSGFTRPEFLKLASIWFAKVNGVLVSHRHQPLPAPQEKDLASSFDLIRDNLAYRAPLDENPALAPFRFLALIDPSDTGVAIDLLQEAQIIQSSSVGELTENVLFRPIPTMFLAQLKKSWVVSEVEAMTSYVGTLSHHLHFRAGDRIRVLYQTQEWDGWWVGSIGHVRGLFPSQWTRVLTVRGEYRLRDEEKQFQEHLVDIPSLPPAPGWSQVLHHMQQHSQPTSAVILHLDDFEDDQDHLMTRVSRQIIDAMRKGDVVVMPYSENVASAFYDLFNRFFTSVPQEDGRHQMFAHIAIGPHSQACPVHRDFKVIMCIPQKQLTSIPLPFLTRFELQRLSQRDALEDIESAWQSVLVQDVPRSVIDVIYDGALDFVRTMETASPGLFFGCVPEETVGSILLQAARTTDCSQGPAFPIIPMPLQKPQEPASSSQSVSSKNVAHRIREAIRDVNYRVMQLARPEVLFQNQVLRKRESYLNEYLLQQEHFSILRLIKQVLTNTPSSSPSKWCIYTRSCGEAHTISTTLASLLQNYRVHLMSLTAMSTASALAEDIRSSGANVLVCVVDMDHCTLRQVTSCCRTMDRTLAHYQQGFVILHYSLASRELVDPYSAVHSNSWEFAYVDAVGVVPEENQEGSMAEPDVRWMARAFGLSTKQVAMDDARFLFREAFFTQLKSVHDVLTINPQHACSSLAIFDRSQDPRGQALQAFFQAQQRYSHDVVEHFLMWFEHSWSSNKLLELIQRGCTQIQEGEVTSSLTRQLTNGLIELLRQRMKVFLRFFYQEHQLYHLAQCPVEGDEEEKDQRIRQIYCRALSLLDLTQADELPTFMEIKEMDHVSMQRKPSRTPLFYNLLAYLLPTIHVVNKQKLPLGQSLQDAHRRLTSHTSLTQLCDDITDHSWEEISLDLVDHLFNLSPPMVSLRTVLAYVWRELADSLRLQSQGMLGTEAVGLGRFLSLLLIRERARDLLVYYYGFFAPLFQKVDWPLSFEWKSFTQRDQPHATSRRQSFPLPRIRAGRVDVFQEDFETTALLNATHLLWQVWRSLVEGAWDKDRFKEWARAFRVLHFRTKDSMNNLAVLLRDGLSRSDTDPQACYTMMLTWFLLMRDFEIPKKSVPLFSPPVGMCLKKISSYHDGFNSAIRFANHLLATKASVAPKDVVYYRRFFEELADSFLIGFPFPPSDAKQADSVDREIANQRKWMLQCMLTMLFDEGHPALTHWWRDCMDAEGHQFLLQRVLSIHPNYFEHVMKELATHINASNYQFRYAVALHETEELPEIPVIPLLYFYLQCHLMSQKASTAKEAENLLSRCVGDAPADRITLGAAQYRLLSLLRDRGSLEALSQGQRGRVAQIIQRGEKNGPLKGVRHALLLNIPSIPEQSLFLQNRELLDQLGLGSWYRSTEGDLSATLSLFPFQLPLKEDEETKCYQQILKYCEGDQPDELAYFIRETNRPYPFRFYLLLVLYYEYFRKGNPCVPIQQVLHRPEIVQALYLTEPELKAYEFFWAGPRPLKSLFQGTAPHSDQREMQNTVFYTFSQEGQGAEEGTSNYLVNILATVLGSQPTRNHMYPIIFALNRFHAKRGYRMIGSAIGGGEFWDCGYQSNDNADLQGFARPLGNNIPLRFFVNSLVWGPLLWNSMLFPTTFVANVKGCYHLANCVREEQGGKRSEFIQYHAYMQNRAVSFFNFFLTQEVFKQKKIDGNLLAMAMLRQFLHVQWSRQTPAELVDIITGSDVLESYEGWWMNLFQQVQNTVPDLTTRYVNAVSAEGILGQMKSWTPSLPLTSSFAQYLEYTNQHPDVLEDTRVFQWLLIHKQTIDLLEYVPRIVRAYQIIHQILSGLLEKEELSLTIEQVIHELRTSKRLSNDQLDTLEQTFLDFAQIYGKVRQMVEEVQFECQAISLPATIKADSFFLSELVSTSDEGRTDLIILLLDQIVTKYQNKLLDTLEFPPDRPVYENSLLWYFDEDNGTAQLASLAQQKTSYCSVLSVQGPTADWIEQVAQRNRLPSSLRHQRHPKTAATPSFDFIQMEREALQFTSGIAKMDVKQLRSPLKLASDIVPPPDAVDQLGEILASSQNTSIPTIPEIWRSCAILQQREKENPQLALMTLQACVPHLIHWIPFFEPLPDSVQRIMDNATPPTSEVTTMIEYFHRTVLALLSGDPEELATPDPQASLRNSASWPLGKVPLVLEPLWKDCQWRHLGTIMQLILALRARQADESLFSECKSHFTPEQKAELQDYRQAHLHRISQASQGDTNANKLVRLKSPVQSTLRELSKNRNSLRKLLSSSLLDQVSAYIQGHAALHKTQAILQNLLPPSIQVCQARAWYRWLLEFNQEIYWASQLRQVYDRSSLDDVMEPGAYQELLPASLQDMVYPLHDTPPEEEMPVPSQFRAGDREASHRPCGWQDPHASAWWSAALQWTLSDSLLMDLWVQIESEELLRSTGTYELAHFLTSWTRAEDTISLRQLEQNLSRVWNIHLEDLTPASFWDTVVPRMVLDLQDRLPSGSSLLVSVESLWMPTITSYWSCCGATSEEKRAVWPLMMEKAENEEEPCASPIALMMRSFLSPPPTVCPHCNHPQGQRVNRLLWPRAQDAHLRLVLAMTGSYQMPVTMDQWDAFSMSQEDVDGVFTLDQFIPQAEVLSGVYHSDPLLRPRYATMLYKDDRWFSVEEDVVNDVSQYQRSAEDDIHLVLLDVQLAACPLRRSSHVYSSHPSSPSSPSIRRVLSVESSPYREEAPSSPSSFSSFVEDDTRNNSWSYEEEDFSTTDPCAVSLPDVDESDDDSLNYYSYDAPETGGEDLYELVDCEECGEPRTLAEPCDMCGSF